MRRLSQELCICVVLICQFSRKAEEGAEPQLDYLRESGQIENDCTWALFLWNEDKNNALSRTPGARRVKFKIPKNRNGQRGLEGVLRFDPITNSFTEA
jgi:replicative DNA helicase